MAERADPLVWVRTAGNWEPEAGPKKANLTQSDAMIGVSQLRVEREDQSTESLAGWARVSMTSRSVITVAPPHPRTRGPWRIQGS